MIIVIPSNRMINLEYLSPLIDKGVRFIVVDDTEGSVTVNHPQFEVYNWGHRRKMLGELEAGFPKRNGASRDYGFYLAWLNSDPDEIIVALDDDCEVYHADFHEQVASVLSNKERPIATCQGDHLNILDMYENVSDDLFPRGFPYSVREGYQCLQLQGASSKKVTFNLGLWRGIFDVNGIDKIKGPEYKHPQATLKTPSAIVEPDKLISVCSMNMQFRASVIPAVYQLPMHVEVMPNWVVDRYGDIWGGFVLKTLMDIKGEAMAMGEPMIHHWKEGDYTRNIWQEHICHLVNDEFLTMLAEIKPKIQSRDYLEMMKELNEEIRSYRTRLSPLLAKYIDHLCFAIDCWTKALDQRG